MGNVRLWFALASVATGVTAPSCLRKTEFHCTSDADCSGGFCEETGYCSFADGSCAMGRRYGELAGPLSNQCVGETPGTDGGMGSDGSSGGGDSGGMCPSGYATISGGGAHQYKILAMARWSTQRTMCAADGPNTYLAIPDDMAEIQALTAFAGAGLTWVGIHDMTSEGQFETVRGGLATYLPWRSGEPNNQGDQDCVAAIMGTGRIETDPCTNSYVAVCECEP